VVGSRGSWEERQTRSGTKQLPSKLLILIYGWKSEMRTSYEVHNCMFESLYYAERSITEEMGFCQSY
jgi:hypothetical protein